MNIQFNQSPRGGNRFKTPSNSAPNNNHGFRCVIWKVSIKQKLAKVLQRVFNCMQYCALIYIKTLKLFPEWIIINPVQIKCKRFKFMWGSADHVSTFIDFHVFGGIVNKNISKKTWCRVFWFLYWIGQMLRANHFNFCIQNAEWEEIFEDLNKTSDQLGRWAGM